MITKDELEELIRNQGVLRLMFISKTKKSNSKSNWRNMLNISRGVKIPGKQLF